MFIYTAEGINYLAWIDRSGRSITKSQQAILNAAECSPDTPALPRDPQHHELVQRGVEHMVAEEKTLGGQLGRPCGISDIALEDLVMTRRDEGSLCLVSEEQEKQEPQIICSLGLFEPKGKPW